MQDEAAVSIAILPFLHIQIDFPLSIFAKKTRTIIEGGDNMNNRFVITFETDEKYLYLSTNFSENQFTTKVCLESIKKVARYVIQMFNSTK